MELKGKHGSAIVHTDDIEPVESVHNYINFEDE